MTGDDKDRAPVRFPPPVCAVVTILLGYGLGRWWPVFPAFGFPEPERYWIGGGIAVFFALTLGAWPALQFRRTNQDLTPWTPSPELVLHGPYKFTRNPMYLMMLGICIGFAFILHTAWILILTPVCAVTIYLIAIRHEEAYLARQFGDSYLDYKKKVRRWI